MKGRVYMAAKRTEGDEGRSAEELREIRDLMSKAIDARDPKKFARALRWLDVDPNSPLGRKRMAAFYRACNLDEPKSNRA
jgi:hypothetical protein